MITVWIESTKASTKIFQLTPNPPKKDIILMTALDKAALPDLPVHLLLLRYR